MQKWPAPINRYVRPLRINERRELVTYPKGGVGIQFHPVEEGVETRWWAVALAVDDKTTFSKSVANNVLNRLAANTMARGVQTELVFDGTVPTLIEDFTRWATTYVGAVDHGYITGALETYLAEDLNKVLDAKWKIEDTNTQIQLLHAELMSDIQGTIKVYEQATDQSR
jgi:hypothetical protein